MPPDPKFPCSAADPVDLSKVKVEFISLTSRVSIPFGYQPYYADPSKMMYAGYSDHVGKAKVTPASARSSVYLRLVQYKKSSVVFPPGWNASPSPGPDTAYQPGNQSEEGSDILKIISGDAPGPVGTSSQFSYCAVGGTATQPKLCYSNHTFNTYLQYCIAGVTDWKTIGKMRWSSNADVKFWLDSSGNMLTSSTGGPGDADGVPSKESPEAP
jgi:hypothetical protein